MSAIIIAKKNGISGFITFWILVFATPTPINNTAPTGVYTTLYKGLTPL
tara:strand:+ start:11469 stop:11615 length:147 start_codon:yes stop_codon:yes gene_type:complete